MFGRRSCSSQYILGRLVDLSFESLPVRDIIIGQGGERIGDGAVIYRGSGGVTDSGCSLVDGSAQILSRIWATNRQLVNQQAVICVAQLCSSEDPAVGDGGSPTAGDDDVINRLQDSSIRTIPGLVIAVYGVTRCR